MIENIQELHEDLMNYLLDRRKDFPDLRWTMRKSNHGGKLSDGYWFEGAINSPIISFWTGRDKKINAPKIFLELTGGGARLVMSLNDTDKYAEYIKNHYLEIINLEKDGDLFTKYYSENVFTNEPLFELLDDFFIRDYNIINELVKNINSELPRGIVPENNVDFIKEEDFTESLEKIERYREIRRQEKEIAAYDEDVVKPTGFRRLTIRNYQQIREVTINISDQPCQCIFLTGENGSGKTQLLRAIVTGLSNREIPIAELKDSNDFYFEADLGLKYKDGDLFRRTENDDVKGKPSVITGLVTYGPFRLDIVSHLIKERTFEGKLGKGQNYNSLFKNNVKLLGLDKQLDVWSKLAEEKREELKVIEKKDYIKNVLTHVVEGLIDIKFKVELDTSATKYVFYDHYTDTEKELTWEGLSSGNRSMIGMLGDIMIRLYHQQKKVSDPAELTGIVVIDEIDLHLHPKAQKELVVKLTDTFPRVQFIASTHSPVPLLGAPENSVFLKVNMEEDGLKINRLKKLEKEFKKLTPNTILTSDIFDFDFWESMKGDQLDNVYLEDDYETIERKKQAENRLNDLSQDVFPEDLFNEER